MMKSILTILFVVATAISIFAQGQIVQPVDGQLYEGWQIKEYFIRHNAPQNAGLIDASKIYKFNKYKGNNGEFTPHCVDCPPSKTETVYRDRIEYRDRIVEKEVQQPCKNCLDEDFFWKFANYLESAYKDAYQNGRSGGGSSYGQYEYMRDMAQLDLAKQQLALMKSGQRSSEARGWFSALSQTGTQIANTFLFKYGMDIGAFGTRINQSFNFPWQQGNDGGFTPDDRLPVGVGGGNNNSNLDPFYPNFSGQNGTSGTNFSNNSSSNQGFIPGDNNAVGSRYVYRQSR